MGVIFSNGDDDDHNVNSNSNQTQEERERERERENITHTHTHTHKIERLHYMLQSKIMILLKLYDSLTIMALICVTKILWVSERVSECMSVWVYLCVYECIRLINNGADMDMCYKDIVSEWVSEWVSECMSLFVCVWVYTSH